MEVSVSLVGVEQIERQQSFAIHVPTRKDVVYVPVPLIDE